MPALGPDTVVRDVVAFGRLLRRAGLEVGPGRVIDAVAGLDAIGVEDGEDVYWTLRATLVSRGEDLDAFDGAFRLWFLGDEPEPPDEAAGTDVRDLGAALAAP